MLSQFIKKYLDSKTVYNNAEKEEVIKFLMNKKAITENDVNDVRRYLKVTKNK